MISANRSVRGTVCVMITVRWLLGPLVAVLLVAAPGVASGASSAAVWPVDPRPAVVRGWEPPASAYGRGHRG
ncbi:hypothetical protein HY68_02240, partial [Streptomyces sp. AcH 505]